MYSQYINPEHIGIQPGATVKSILSDDEKFSVLSAYAPFNKMPEKACWELARYARYRTFAANSNFFRGDPGDGMMLIVSGRVRSLYTTVRGREIILDDHMAGTCLGQLKSGAALLTNLCFREDSALLGLTRAQIERVGQRYPDIYPPLLEHITTSFSDLFSLFELFTDNCLKARVGSRLLGFARRLGEKTPQGLRLPVLFNQSELAALSHGSRQQVNVILKNWERGGILCMSQDYLIITDVKALIKEVENSLLE